MVSFGDFNAQGIEVRPLLLLCRRVGVGLLVSTSAEEELLLSSDSSAVAKDVPLKAVE
jgi:hypothetical protein